MFNLFGTNPAAALKDDHDRVKTLFDEFEAAKSRPAKVKLVRSALTEPALTALFRGVPWTS